MLIKHIQGDLLDVGCGLGDFLENASKNSLGIDINPYNVEHCIKEFKRKINS